MKIPAARRLRSAAVLIAAGLWVCAGAGEAAAQVRIGVVDLNRAMEQSSAGKAALDLLKKVGEDLRQQLGVKGDALRRMEEGLLKTRQDLRQKSLLFSDEVRRQKEDELVRQQREFERSRDELVRLRREAEADFERERARVTAKVRREVADVISRIGKKEKYTLILERAVVLFFDGERVDLTDNVIKAYNQAKP